MPTTLPPLVAASLDALPCLRDLAPATRRALAQGARVRRFDKGETILETSDRSASLHLIVSGSVRVNQIGGAGRLLTFELLPAGEMFGEITAIDGLGRSASVVAEEETVLVEIPQQRFRELVHQAPEFAELLLLRLARLARRLTLQLVEQHTLDVPARLCALLLRLHGEHPEGIPVSDRDLASRIGTTRENVSRNLSALRRRGLIERSRHTVRVLEPDALEEIVREGQFG